MATIKYLFFGVLFAGVCFGYANRHKSAAVTETLPPDKNKSDSAIGNSELDSLFSSPDSVRYISGGRAVDSGFFETRSYNLQSGLGLFVFAADLRPGKYFVDNRPWHVVFRNSKAGVSTSTVFWHYCQQRNPFNARDSSCSKEFSLTADTLDILNRTDSSMVFGLHKGNFVLHYYDYRFLTQAELKGYARYELSATFVFRRLRNRIYIFMLHGNKPTDSIPEKLARTFLR